MKTIRIFGTRGFLATALSVTVGIGFVSPVFAQTKTSVIVNPDGKVTYLGTLGGSYSVARGINDSGQVVGISRIADGHDHAFITGPDGMGMTDIGTLGGSHSNAISINASGQVAGVSNPPNGSRHAFFTGSNGMGMTDLGTLGGGSSAAYGINDSGQVAGSSTVMPPPPYADGSYHAFITGPGGMGMRDLGTLGGDYRFANDINDSGQVVGVSATAVGALHGFITGPDGMGMTDLSTLGVPFSTAYGINDSGQVMGNTVYPYRHAFITGPNGMGMTDLGTLGGVSSHASDINDSGQVVGYSDTADGDTHAFITGPNGMGMTDLNSIVDLPEGSHLSDAQGINNQGQIIATVSTIPEPASYALMLAGLGLVGFMARSKKQVAQVSCMPAPV